MQPVIASIDQGTTGTRVIVFSLDGQILSSSYRELTQHYPRPGWVEHDAEEIARAVEALLDESLSAAGLPRGARGALQAIGITNQRETIVLWDRATGAPVARAIVWQDRRTADLCRRLRADGRGGWFYARTGLTIDPYFSGTKLAWLLDSRPELRARAEEGELAAGTIDSWLIDRLTRPARGAPPPGPHVTDVTNASRTMLMDLRRLDWDDEILRLLRIPRAVLPEIRPSSAEFGRTDPAGCVGASAPITGVVGDQQAALFGQACFGAGEVKNTYGTGAFVLMHAGRSPSPHDERTPAAPILTTVAWQHPGRPAEYALEGSIFIAGAAVQWLRDGLGLISRAGDAEALARSVHENEGVYFVPALTGLGSPYWDPSARGVLIGLTRGTRPAHIARAALEAIAYQSRDILETMRRHALVLPAILKADGGAAGNSLLMQFQADVLGVPVEVPEHLESTAVGAAWMAGLGAGIWSEPSEPASLRRVARRYEPSMDPALRERLYARWLRAVERSRGWEE